MAKGRTGLSQDQGTAEEFSPDGEWTFLLVRTTGLLRVRNTMPEDIRTGLTSFTKTSDDTDVPVVDAHGRRRGHQPAKLLPPVTVRLRRAPRPLSADLLDPRPLFRLAPEECSLLLAELRPLHGLFPDGSKKTRPRVFPSWMARVPASRSPSRCL